MIFHIIFILYFLTYCNWFFILYFDREYFIVSLKIENDVDNIEIATEIKNRMKHQLEQFSIIFSKNIQMIGWRCS
jgi:hypothetical protein